MDLPLRTARGRSRVGALRTGGGEHGLGEAGGGRPPAPSPLGRRATLLTRDASMAEELVQDAFVSLHRRWGALADPGAAHGYLRTTVINNARSVLRHRGVEERYRQAPPPEPSGPEERAVQATEDARVMAALRTLSRRQQEVLVLRYYADLSEQDIASTLGLTRGAVKSHAHRGLA